MKNIRIIISFIICLLISTSVTTSISFQNNNENYSNQDNETIATFYLYKPDGFSSTDYTISYETGYHLIELFKESIHDSSKKDELINTLIDLGVIHDNSLFLKTPPFFNNFKPTC